MPSRFKTAAPWADLVRGRLGTVLPADRAKDFRDHALAAALAAGMTEDAWRTHLQRLPLHAPDWQHLMAVLTVGETYLWRHDRHMRLLLETVLPEVLAKAEAAGRPAVIWSAGCSTGEEVYTLAMLVEHLRPGQSAEKVRIVGTDVHHQALATARRGVYGGRSLRALPPDGWQRRYLVPLPDGKVQVADRLRRAVTFAPLELTHDAPETVPQLKGGVDLILCRNVMIYLTPDGRETLLGNFARVLRPDGWLLLGDTEVDDRVHRCFRLHDLHAPSLFHPSPSAGPERGSERPRSVTPLMPARFSPVHTPAVPRPDGGEAPASMPAAEGPPAVGAYTLTGRVAALVAADRRPDVCPLVIAAASLVPGSLDLYLALAYVALVDGDVERAIVSLQRAMLISASPLVGGVLAQIRSHGTDGDWSGQLLTLAAVLTDAHGKGHAG